MSGRADLEAADALARARARGEFARPLVLEAGAGTGKTSALVARVLGWSLGPGWERAAAVAGAPRAAVAERVLSRVVAITFTELAAAEMEERVARVLAALVHWDGRDREPVLGLPLDEVGTALAALARDPAELRSRARALSDALDALSVSTIHSFAGRLLAEHAVAAGLHPQFRVDADGAQARAAVDEILAEEIPRALGADGDRDWEVLLAAEIGPTRLREALLALARSGRDPDLLAGDPLAPERVEAERRRLLAWAESLLAVLAPAFAGQKFRSNSKTPRGLDALRALVRELGGPAGEASLFAALRAPEVEAGQGKLLEWADDGPNDTEAKALGADAERVRPLAAEGARRLFRLAAVEPDVLRAAQRVLRALWSRAGEVLRARGVLGFDDLLARAAELLRRDPAARAAVRSSIDQLLIDEFQDTDPLQYEIASAIALPQAPGDDRGALPGLFLVGDPKQSIYAWRGADLGAYEAFLQRVLAAGGAKASLVRNFRSSQAVLDEVERLVAPSMRREAGLQPEFEPLVESRERVRAAPGWLASGPRHAVEHWVSWDLGQGSGGDSPARTSATRARELEAGSIASDLVELAGAGLGRELPWSEVAILLRTGTQQQEYLEALRRAGIPCAVERDRHFYQSREIEEATSLVACVLAPADALALAAALRTSVVGAPDAALEPLWSRGFPSLCAHLESADPPALAEIDRRIEDVARELAADAELQAEDGLSRIPHWPAALRDFAQALGELREAFAREPADGFVARLRARLGFEETEAARWLGPHRVAKLERFFRELCGALAATSGGARAVLRELEARLEGERDPATSPGADEDENAVRLLTIHGAKGLEFSLVYLADLHHGAGGDRGARFQHALAGGRFEFDLFGMPSLGWSDVEQRRRDVEERELARLLYVATTRAKDRLVLAGNWPAPGQRASQAPLLELVVERRGGAPDLEVLAQAAISAESSGSVLFDSALWRFPERGPEARALETTGTTLDLDPEQVRADAARVAAAIRDAEEREKLPLTRAATARLEDETESPRRRSARAADALPRHLARAVGVAVHRALEELDPAASTDAELRRLCALADRSLATSLDANELAAASADARTLLERCFAPPLGERLRAIGPAILGREVPVLLAPDGDSPTATIGSIDLLHRGGAEGALVVADYKTDRVDSAEDLEEIESRYRAQLGAYAEAARLALGAPASGNSLPLRATSR